MWNHGHCNQWHKKEGGQGGMWPANFSKGPKVPFFVMKSALFVNTNVVVKTAIF